MPSPFPGMNPYLEHPNFWPEIHHWLITVMAESLIPQLLPKYIATINQQVYLTTPEDTLTVGIPDVTVRQNPEIKKTSANLGVTVAAEPAKVTLPMPVEVKHNYLEIKETASKRVVTAIEVLSPRHKQLGFDREKYELKRERIFSSITHLVEIDLLRSGKPMRVVQGEIESHYRVLVSRSDRRPTGDMYAFNLQGKIPLFPLPLQPGDTEPVIDLKDLLDLVYDRARYDAIEDVRPGSYK